MCGIAGFSLSPNSNIDARKLAHELLCAIEDRGYMASGYAYQVGNQMGYHKQAVTGSKLSVKQMPRRASHVILHTRLATHGSIHDNNNNHPVMSPSQDIALVHNGVIYNHEDVRLKITADLPDVDTSVIPAVIEQLGVDSLDVLDGDAAIAWFNRAEPETLHLARYQHSPLVICQVKDGSFIFASTEPLLNKALKRLKLKAVWTHFPKELEHYIVKNGVVTAQQALPQPKFYNNVYDYGYYRHQTSGAKSSSGYKKWSWEEDYVPTSSLSYDDDEYWDMPIADIKSERVGADEDTKYDSRYYTVVADSTAGKTFTFYYTYDEHDIWEEELWVVEESDYMELVDFGEVIRGQLVSDMNLLGSKPGELAVEY